MRRGSEPNDLTVSKVRTSDQRSTITAQFGWRASDVVGRWAASSLQVILVRPISPRRVQLCPQGQAHTAKGFSCADLVSHLYIEQPHSESPTGRVNVQQFRLVYARAYPTSAYVNMYCHLRLNASSAPASRSCGYRSCSSATTAPLKLASKRLRASRSNSTIRAWAGRKDVPAPFAQRTWVV